MKKVVVLFFLCVISLVGCSADSDTPKAIAKPSKDVVITALLKKVDSSDLVEGASPEEIQYVKDVFSCTIQNAYDKLSAETLNYLANDSNDFDDIDRDIVGEQNIILKDASDICAGDTGKETEDVNVDGE